MSQLLREIQKWVAGSVAWEHDHWDRGRSSSRLLLGTLVYGRYVDRFLQYCVPSLISNLRGLSSRPLLVIHTDEASLPRITQGLRLFHTVADVEVHPISQDLLSWTELNSDGRYTLLGASEIIHMKRAFFRGMHYHCMFPDTVYSAGYFAQLERIVLQGYEAVLSHGLNASLEDIAPHLVPDLLAAPLASLALDHMHPRQRGFVMNAREEDFPIVAHLVYIGEQSVSAIGMHSAATFLHNRLLSFAPLRLNTTLDSMIPLYVPEGVPVYMPSAQDGMTLVELSDADWTLYHRQPGCSLKEFAIRFWVLAGGDRGFERVLQLTTEFSLERSTPWNPLTDEEVRRSIASIREYVASLYPSVETAFELGGVLEESGINGPLQLPQDRLNSGVSSLPSLM